MVSEGYKSMICVFNRWYFKELSCLLCFVTFPCLIFTLLQSCQFEESFFEYL